MALSVWAGEQDNSMPRRSTESALDIRPVQCDQEPKCRIAVPGGSRGCMATRHRSIRAFGAWDRDWAVRPFDGQHWPAFDSAGNLLPNALGIFEECFGSFQRLLDVLAVILASDVPLKLDLRHELHGLRPCAAQDQDAPCGVKSIGEVFQCEQPRGVDGSRIFRKAAR